MDRMYLWVLLGQGCAFCTKMGGAGSWAVTLDPLSVLYSPPPPCHLVAIVTAASMLEARVSLPV